MCSRAVVSSCHPTGDISNLGDKDCPEAHATRCLPPADQALGGKTATPVKLCSDTDMSAQNVVCDIPSTWFSDAISPGPSTALGATFTVPLSSPSNNLAPAIYQSDIDIGLCRTATFSIRAIKFNSQPTAKPRPFPTPQSSLLLVSVPRSYPSSKQTTTSSDSSYHSSPPNPPRAAQSPQP